MLVAPSAATISDIPVGVTDVFLGEQGLDITATGVTVGSPIVHFNPGADILNDTPADVVIVSNPASFYASPAQFFALTGAWYQPENNLQVTFILTDPSLRLRVINYRTGQEVGTESVAGDPLGFRIETNLNTMARRPGVVGAPITIHIRDPTGVEFTSVEDYVGVSTSLVNIPVHARVYDTGPVWATHRSQYTAGWYEVWADCNANGMRDNYKVVGKTTTRNGMGVEIGRVAVVPIISTPTTIPTPPLTPTIPAAHRTPATRSISTLAPIITQTNGPSTTTQPVAPLPTPIVIVVERTADIDPGMTRYSGPTAPPTTSEPQSAETARQTKLPSTTIVTVATTTAPTTTAPPIMTYEAAVATTSALTDNGSLIVFVVGVLLAALGLVIGGIVYRSYTSRRDAPVEIMGKGRYSYPTPTSITSTPVGSLTVQVPWKGYNPLASDSYDLLARLRRYDDGVRQTGLGATVPIADRLDLSLVPTLPIPAIVKELGPGIGCRVLSIDDLGSAVCLRDEGRAVERFDVVRIDEIMRLIEEQYEQRWVPRKSGAD